MALSPGILRTSTHCCLLLAGIAVATVAACTDDEVPPADANGGGGATAGAGAPGTGAGVAGTASDGGADTGAGEPPVGVVIPAVIEAEAFVRWEETDEDEESMAPCAEAAPDTPDVLALDAASGGCFVGYTGAGEYLEYDVHVPAAGAYDMVFRVASGLGGRRVTAYSGDVQLGTIDVPATDWEEFGDVVLPRVNLAAGNHQLRIVFDSGAVNLDTFELKEAGPCEASCGDRTCGVDECGNSCGSCEEGTFCTDSQVCFDPGPTPTQTPVARWGQLSVSGTKIVGAGDAEVQLKGVSSQWLNWEQDYSTSKDALLWMRDNWRLSVFRVANGVEANNGYLEDPTGRMAMVKGIIDNAIDAGVYVIVDWHTHLLSAKDDAKAFFTEIAQTYGDEPNIIYEVFNEPIEQDWSTELKPYHDELVATIRAEDPDNLIILGTPQWDQRPDVAIDDPVVGTNLLYALHFYSCSHSTSIRENGRKAIEAGLPLFVSEWGATHADGGTANNPGVCARQARLWHNWMDSEKISWAAWKLNDDGDTSSLLAAGAPTEGGWTESDLAGHGPLVRDLLLGVP